MFVHIVLFKIKPSYVKTYRKDCAMWMRQAARYRGFIAYKTFLRTNEKDQYASCYMWDKQTDHEAFMKAQHERLVGLSKCPVDVVGYYNYKTITPCSRPQAKISGRS